MEQLVEQYASKLLSDDYARLSEVFDAIETLKGKMLDSPSVRCKVSRLLQELLAYKRGAVVQRVVQLLLTKRPTIKSFKNDRVKTANYRLYLASCMTLATLSESQVVARFCVKEKKTTRMLATELIYLHKHGRALLLENIAEKNAENLDFSMRLSLDAIRGFLNLSRASDHFRRTLQEIDDLFPALEKLLVTLHDSAKMIPEGQIQRALTYSIRLVYTLILSEDSQQWALDKGLLRIQAASARLLMLDNLANGSPMGMLGRSMINEGGLQDLQHLDVYIRDSRNTQTAGAIRALYLYHHKKLLGILGPTFAGLTGMSPSVQRALEGDDHESLKYVKALAGLHNGRSDAPVVCSWELCGLGSMPEDGTKFSKCAECSLAYYCSKEHQKLHWRSHKKQCKDASSTTSSRKPSSK